MTRRALGISARHLLVKAGVAAPKYRRRKPQIARHSDEWTIRELAEHLGMPQATLTRDCHQEIFRSL